MATFYVPNSQKDLFSNHNLEKLLEFADGQLILGGDFNVPLIPCEDASLGSSSTPPDSLKCIAQSFHKAQLVDVWLLLHSS